MTSTPASSLTMENIRCFSKAKMELRPLTLLLGESSTGKSTAMGSHLTAQCLLGVPSAAPCSVPFNHSPHRMGRFKDIVRTSGKSTKAGKVKASPIILTHDHGALRCKTWYGEDDAGEVSVDRVLLKFGDGRKTTLDLRLHDKDAIVSLPGKKPGELAFKVPRRMIEAHGMRKCLQSIFQQVDVNKSHRSAGILRRAVESIMVTLPIEGFVSMPFPQPRLQRRYDADDLSAGTDGIDSILGDLHGHCKSKSDYWKAMKRRIDDFATDTGIFNDFGIRFDDTAVGSFELTGWRHGKEINLFDMGTGVWPAVMQLIAMEDQSIRGKRNFFHCQHFEGCSHPRLHTSLLHIIYEHIGDGSQFLLETHSDLTLMKLAVDIYDGKIDPDLISIAYFEQDLKTHSCKIHNLKFGEDGLLLEQPDCYRWFYYDLVEKYVMASVGIGSEPSTGQQTIQAGACADTC